MTHILSSRHDLKFANDGKLAELRGIIEEYRRCAGVLVDYLWENGYEWQDSKDEVHKFLPKKKLLETPSFISGDVIKKSGLATKLTARLLSCCLTQVAGMLGAECEKQRKRLYSLKKLKDAGGTKRQLKKLIAKIKQNNPVKPKVGNINMELNSICCDFQEIGGYFGGFLRLKSISKDKTEILLPIKFSAHSAKLAKRGKLKTSFLIAEDFVNSRWEIETPEIVGSIEKVGADQGYKDVLTVSKLGATPKEDNHHHTLESIIAKVSRKKKGSKAFARAKEHQVNFVNWSINQLNFKEVREVRLEEVRNIGYKSRTSRKLSHWQNTIIRDKVKSKCRDEGTRFVLQSSTYRSQRCSNPECGNVRKANRKGKVYTCKRCGLVIDSDLNAALNHEQDLPDVPYALRALELNRGLGFLWKADGFFDLQGGSLQSPPKMGE